MRCAHCNTVMVRAAHLWLDFMKKFFMLNDWDEPVGRVADRVVRGLWGEAFQSAHVGTQDGGDANAAVGLLVVFQDGDEGAAYGEARAVKGMDELRFVAVLRAVACLHAARLEVAAV